jgi:hypothetical protein
MQTLDEFIQKFFNDKSAFAEFIDVSTFQVTKWISDGWYVEENKLFSPEQKLHKYVIANNAFYSEKKIPLYFEDNAPIECNPSLVFDIETGEIYIALNHGCPSTYFRTILSFSLNKELTTNEVSNVIEQHLGKFQKILNGAHVEYDGTNFVGQFNQDAEIWIEDLENTLRDVDSSEDNYILDDVDPFLEDDPFGIEYEAKSLDDVASHTKAMIEKLDSVVLSDSLSSNFERAILDFYHYVLSECYIPHETSVPKWVFKIGELSYFEDAA